MCFGCGFVNFSVLLRVLWFDVCLFVNGRALRKIGAHEKSNQVDQMLVSCATTLHCDKELVTEVWRPYFFNLQKRARPEDKVIRAANQRRRRKAHARLAALPEFQGEVPPLVGSVDMLLTCSCG